MKQEETDRGDRIESVRIKRPRGVTFQKKNGYKKTEPGDAYDECVRGEGSALHICYCM